MISRIKSFFYKIKKPKEYPIIFFDECQHLIGFHRSGYVYKEGCSLRKDRLNIFKFKYCPECGIKIGDKK